MRLFTPYYWFYPYTKTWEIIVIADFDDNTKNVMTYSFKSKINSWNIDWGHGPAFTDKDLMSHENRIKYQEIFRNLIEEVLEEKLRN